MGQKFTHCAIPSRLFEPLPEAASISRVRKFAAGEWSELGSRDMDCIGRIVIVSDGQRKPGENRD
jgi:hypothetical protein